MPLTKMYLRWFYIFYSIHTQMKRQKIVIILLAILNIVVLTLFTLNWLDQQLEIQLKEQKLKDEQFRLNQLMEKQDEYWK